MVNRKGSLESHFIEVILNCGGCESGCTGTLLSPQAHYVEMVVEGILIGPSLDDCLLSFIRRVFEEIDIGKKSPHLLCSNCKSIQGILSILYLVDLSSTTPHSSHIQHASLSLSLSLSLSTLTLSHLSL
jgi:hypothetical protein